MGPRLSGSQVRSGKKVHLSVRNAIGDDGPNCVGAATLRKRSLTVCVAIVALLACSDRPAGPALPSEARVAVDGSRWIQLKAGSGKLGAHSVWWSLDWREFPCDPGFCPHVYNGRADSKIYDPFRANVLQMREGEVRRIWLRSRDGYVYDVHLERVFETDGKGEPIIVND